MSRRLVCLWCVVVSLLGVSAQTFNVKEYGATGDGTTDDTLAVAKACAALQASATGGEVYFPDGTYLFNENVESYIFISAQNSSVQYNVRGESTASTILSVNLDVTAFALITLDLFDPDIVSVTTHMANFTVLARTTPNAPSMFDAISLWGVVDSSIRGVHFIAAGPVGSMIDISAYNNGTAVDPRGIVLQDVTFSGPMRDAVDIEGPGISDIQFINVVFEVDPTVTPPFAVQGVRLGDRITNVLFQHCQFSNLDTGLVTYASSTSYPASVKQITVLASTFNQVTRGVWVNDNSSVTVSDCAFTNSQPSGAVQPTGGILSGPFAEVVATGNEFTCLNVGVSLVGQGSISGNTFTSNTLAFSFDSATASFELVQNTFNANGQTVIVAQGVEWTVEDNECIGALGSSSFVCSAGPCTNTGNTNCEFTAQTSDAAREPIALA